MQGAQSPFFTLRRTRMKMRFREDGTFKIMQITDMQEIPAISKDTIALMERAVLEEQPDLVVYTGDQIKGYGVTYKGKGEELEREVAQTIGKLLEPVTKRGIPFAVTFGNHDCQVGISNQDQFYHIYKRLPNCIGEQAEGIDGGGTCAIPIEASDGSGRDVFELYLFDSGTDAREGGYEAFDPKIIAWYRKQREDLREKNGMYVPSIVFQHIPMREYYEVLKLVDRGEKGAVRAYRTHKNEYYKLGETCGAGDIFLEPPPASRNFINFHSSACLSVHAANPLFSCRISLIVFPFSVRHFSSRLSLILLQQQNCQYNHEYQKQHRL